MADILIRNLKMPDGANQLRLIIQPNGQAIIDKQTFCEETEAIEIPDHGRLIDADELLEQTDYIEAEFGHIHEEIRDMPTVIPESKEET